MNQTARPYAIEVERLSKVYELGPTGAKTLRELISTAFARSKNETFLALDDVSFTLQQGESLAIIGRNGAGKSTLLKILSKITKPSEGMVRINGRVSSLLEVGTGFHPELTGRENIFLNGAILGMSQVEIKRRFDEIVDFSGIERFIDTPVKRYSSGMYVRLAFAVAAHLEPEILIVDEVLAVGDAEFQQKCIGKMGSVAQSGRSVILVSHNMKSVERLCDRVLVLDQGQKTFEGKTRDAIQYYIASGAGRPSKKEWDQISAPGDEYVRLLSVTCSSSDPDATQAIDISCEIDITIEYEILRGGKNIHPAILITDRLQRMVFFSGGFHDREWINDVFDPGKYVARCTIPGNFMSDNMFLVTVVLHSQEKQSIEAMAHVREVDVVSFSVVDPMTGNSARGFYKGEYRGLVRPILPWNTSKIS